jgi:hypothetical protein
MEHSAQVFRWRSSGRSALVSGNGALAREALRTGDGYPARPGSEAGLIRLTRTAARHTINFEPSPVALSRSMPTTIFTFCTTDDSSPPCNCSFMHNRQFALLKSQ